MTWQRRVLGYPERDIDIVNDPPTWNQVVPKEEQQK